MKVGKLTARAGAGVLLAIAQMTTGCGSEIGPPPGWVAPQDEPPPAADIDAQNDDTSQVPDAEPEVEPECTVDADCSDLATFACRVAVCDSGECVAQAAPDGSLCDDNDACTVGDACQGGSCIPESSLSCDDGDPCTDDSCDENNGGCVQSPNTGAFCNDGQTCTFNDACLAGVCQGTATPDCYSGSCCAANDTPGCEDQQLRGCVCAANPSCCDLEGTWTANCVALVESAGCGFCPPETCGNGECDGDEGCSSCPADCGPCIACGDGNCGDNENCFSCNVDCGDCAGAACGDLACKSPLETCETCPADCGICSGAVCGDGTCELDENCQNCDADCGPCAPGCGDGVCTVGEDCVGCPIDCGVCVGDCCGQKEGPGCSQPLIEQCVCSNDDYCCNESWDGVCVAQVEFEGCADCNAVVCGDNICTTDEETCETCELDCGACPFCGDGICQQDSENCANCTEDCGECPVDAGTCCQVQFGPGCSDPAAEACVCAQDSYCCSTQWDDICVDNVTDFNCGVCGSGGPPGGGGGCCNASGSPGCSDPVVESCVCNTFLGFLCCFDSWSPACVQLVEDLGCGTCP